MPYPQTVRAGVLSKIVTVLGDTIPELKTIRKFEVVPADLLAIELPAAYLFEIAPEDRSYQNRIAVAKMHLVLQFFFNLTMKDQQNNTFDDAHDFMEYLTGSLHGMFHGDVGLSKNGLVNVVEITYDRIITNESVGMLVATFDVEYRHDRGNAFS
jgi:hypothetical protein